MTASPGNEPLLRKTINELFQIRIPTMENEELRKDNECCETGNEELVPESEPVCEIMEAAETEGPAAVEETAPDRAPSAASSPLVGVDIDEEKIKTTSRLTPEYLKMLEEREKEMEKESMADPVSRTYPVPDSPADRERSAINAQIDQQKTIIEENRRAWFGKRRRIRKEAEKRLAELEQRLASLDQ